MTTLLVVIITVLAVRQSQRTEGVASIALGAVAGILLRRVPALTRSPS